MANPTASLCMANGAQIVIELLPQAAPNTVNSFLWAASHGWMDHHAIERIVPGDWIDVSYTAFHHKECRYLIPNEFSLHPDIVPLPSHPGCVCMGGYGEAGLSGCEFFFPLRDCPEHSSIYPVFGRVIAGMDEIWRLSRVPTCPVLNFPFPDVKVNCPSEPQVIDHIELQLSRTAITRPRLMEVQALPPNWRDDFVCQNQ